MGFCLSGACAGRLPHGRPAGAASPRGRAEAPWRASRSAAGYETAGCGLPCALSCTRGGRGRETRRSGCWPACSRCGARQRGARRPSRRPRPPSRRACRPWTSSCLYAMMRQVRSHGSRAAGVTARGCASRRGRRAERLSCSGGVWSALLCSSCERVKACISCGDAGTQAGAAHPLLRHVLPLPCHETAPNSQCAAEPVRQGCGENGSASILRAGAAPTRCPCAAAGRGCCGGAARCRHVGGGGRAGGRRRGRAARRALVCGTSMHRPRRTTRTAC